MAEMVPFDPKPKSPRLAEAAKPSPAAVPLKSLDRQEFTSEEVSEIIRVALRKSGGDGSSRVSHEEMITIGREFGLTENDLAGALNTISQSREDEERFRIAKTALHVHVLCFGVVNLGLFAINMLSGSGQWWFLYPLVSWGIALAIHAIVTKYLPKLIPATVHLVGNRSTPRTATLAESSRVTFKIPDVYHDLASCRGLAQMRDDVLILEFEVEDGIFGLLRSGVKEVHIPVDEIVSVKLERWLAWTTLKIQGRRLHTLQRIPGHKGGAIKLAIDREAHDAAVELASRLAAMVDRA